jgi:Suppressor of fused protein (SUFU)
MSLLRRAPRQSGTVVFSDASPYRSRRLDIEADEVSTVAYLRDSSGAVIGAAWVANHVAALATLDLARLNSGLAPSLPAGLTSHPEGRKPLDTSALEVVWFEGGDGAAVLEAGEPLCVLPGWSDLGRGLPGYSRDAIGQGPFALPFGGRDFQPSIQRARAHWARQQDSAAWGDFQQAVLGHLLGRLGPGGQYLHDVARRQDGGPVIAVSERPSRENRPYTVLSTLGMSRQQMPAADPHEEDTACRDRVELALATTLPSGSAGRVLAWLAPSPWRSATRLVSGDVVPWSDRAAAFPLGERWAGVLLLDDPAVLAPGRPAPDLSGFRVDAEPVRWLWLVPITADERALAAEEGPDALIRQLTEAGRSWVATT